MSHRRQWRLSLRTRLMLWQLAVLAPLLLAAFFHHLYLMPRFTAPLTKIANEITHEVLQIKDLQFSLQKSAMPVNDYLIHGRQDEITEFNVLRQQVDTAFSSTKAIPFVDTHEQQLVEAAWQEWQQAKRFAAELLGSANPVGKPGLADKMEQFDQYIDSASARLEQLYKLAYEEIKQAQAEARVARSGSQNISIVAFVFAIALSLVIGMTLSQAMRSSLNSLRKGARQIAAGNFCQQVVAYGIDELEELADAFNSMASKILHHNAVLEDMAIRDALTGLENRRALVSRLEEEFIRAVRYQHPLSLLMLDIDHFKKVNDTYGHQAGDDVLCKLADIIKSVVRPMDRVFRYGGEEFVILVPETERDGAESLGERIREAVALAPFLVCGQTELHITISIGVATYPRDVAEKETLVTAADQAMYQAKQSGRNRVCVHLRLV